jgi:hypothetical protein
LKAKRALRYRDFGWRGTGAPFKALVFAGVVAALAVAPSTASARPPSGPVHFVAQASVADCDGDGDPEDTLDPLECGGSLQKPEPDKLYSKGEKHQFEETALEYRRAIGKICGTTGAAYASRVALLTIFTLGGEAHFILLCVAMAKLANEYEILAQDPPDPAVFTVALPKRAKRARAPTAAGRGYLTAIAQKAAFSAALGTSLNRLSSTPESPEEITATPVPKYSRRLQVGAARLYSGLVAAWGERQSLARARVLALVRRHGAAAVRGASKALPKSADTKDLWRAFKSLTAPEYGQLTADLYQQVIEARFLSTLKKIVANVKAGGSLQKAKQELEALEKVQDSFRASQTAMFTDLGALLEASESSSGNLAPLAKAAIKQAAKLPRVPGITKYAPQAGLVARLVSFGGAAFLPGKPKPFPAG